MSPQRKIGYLMLAMWAFVTAFNIFAAWLSISAGGYLWWLNALVALYSIWWMVKTVKFYDLLVRAPRIGKWEAFEIRKGILHAWLAYRTAAFDYNTARLYTTDNFKGSRKRDSRLFSDAWDREFERLAVAEYGENWRD